MVCGSENFQVAEDMKELEAEYTTSPHLAPCLFAIWMLLCISSSCCCCPLSRVLLFATLWTEAHQVPLSMGFPRQECWGGLPFPSPEDLPDPGIEPMSPALADRFFTAEPSGKPTSHHTFLL